MADNVKVLVVGSDSLCFVSLMQDALVEFENIISLEPRNFVGDSGARNTPIFKVTQYNVACCYAMLDQVGRCACH